MKSQATYRNKLLVDLRQGLGCIFTDVFYKLKHFLNLMLSLHHTVVVKLKKVVVKLSVIVYWSKEIFWSVNVCDYVAQ